MTDLRVVKIDEIKDGIRLKIENVGFVYFYKFGKTILTKTNQKVQKKVFKEFKQDILKTNWNVEQLRQNWIVTNN